MASTRQSLQQFQQIFQSLEEEWDRLRTQSFGTQPQVAPVLDESKQVGSAQSDAGRLLARINSLNCEVLVWKMGAVQEYIQGLQQLCLCAPRSPTPLRLTVRHYQQRLDTDEELYLLQVQLLDFQQFIASLKKRRNLLGRKVKVSAQGGFEFPGDPGVDKGQLSKQKALADAVAYLHGRVASYIDRQSMEASLFLNEIISPTHKKTTDNLVSHRVRNYVVECSCQGGDSAHPAVDSQGHPLGCNPDRYTAFMEVLVSHLNRSYGKMLDLEKDDIYILLEDHVMPQVREYALPYVRSVELDQRIAENCHKFRHITPANLGLKELECRSLVPFVEAIAAIKASCFYPNPTRKMLSFVKAAKCVLQCIRSQMDPSKIDADLFLDSWVYVLIKASVKDLATTVEFMCQFGNPAFCSSETGYYLTTTQVAMNFITTMSADDLAFTQREVFLSCEFERYIALSSVPSSPFDVVGTDITVTGFRAAVAPDTAWDDRMFSHSVLIPTGSDQDKVSNLIAVRSAEGLSEDQAGYVHRGFTTSPFEGVKLQDFPHGKMLTLSKEHLEKYGLPSDWLMVPDDKSADELLRDVRYASTLLSLDCERAAFQRRPQRHSYQPGSTAGSPPPVASWPAATPPPASPLATHLPTTSPVATSSLSTSSLKTPLLTTSPLTTSSLKTPLLTTSPLTTSSQKTPLLTTSCSSTSHPLARLSSGSTTSTPATSSVLASSVEMPPLLTTTAQPSPRSIATAPSPPLIITVPPSSSSPPPSTARLLSSSSSSSQQRQQQQGEHLRVAVELHSRSPRATPSSSFRSTESGSLRRSATGPSKVSRRQGLKYEELLKENSISNLESNFMANYFPQVADPVTASDARARVKQIVLEVQVHLQLLNYLSPLVRAEGAYTPATASAVAMFQEECGDRPTAGATAAEAGVLTVSTRHKLRGRMLEISSSIAGLGFPNFPDPLDVSEASIQAMRTAIEVVQDGWGLTERGRGCRRGVFCADTLDELNRRARIQIHATRLHSM